MLRATARRLGPFLLVVLALGIWRQLPTAGDDSPQERPAGAMQNGERKPLVGRLAGSRDDCSVSLVRLIANPEQYHNRRIRVKGFLVVEFEGTGIYLSRDDANHLIRVNGFRVSFDRTKVPLDGPHGPARFANQYVALEGTFNMDNPAHWQGAIIDVDRVRALDDYSTQREHAKPRKIEKQSEDCRE
jgi:hypothetical protein